MKGNPVNYKGSGFQNRRSNFVKLLMCSETCVFWLRAATISHSLTSSPLAKHSKMLKEIGEEKSDRFSKSQVTRTVEVRRGVLT